MDDLNNDNNQPLDSMGEPITPLGSHPTNPLAPDNMNSRPIPRNPLAPEPGDMPPMGGGMPMDNEMPTNNGGPMNGGMPPRNPLAPEPGEMPPMNNGMPMNGGMPMGSGMPQNEMPQGYGQPMPMQNPMMYSQPIDPYGPAMGGYTMDGGKKNSKLFPIIMIVVGLILFVVLLILPNILPGGGSGGEGGGNGGSSENGGDNQNENENGENEENETKPVPEITQKQVVEYCSLNGYNVEQGKAEDIEEADGIYKNALEFVSCSKTSTAYDMIAYVKVDGKILEDDAAKNLRAELFATENDVKTVVSETDHQEYISAVENFYLILHNDVALVVMDTDTDKFEKILTSVRGEYDLNKKYKDIVERNVMSEKENVNNPAARDTTRKNDISRVNTSLVQYQTNHNTMSNNLPSAGMWTGTSDFKEGNDCNTTDVACLFVRDYMNSVGISGADNDFKDPSGKPYNVLITSNWASGADGTLGVITFNDNSKLIEKDGGYTIGGNNPFSEHVVYIIPGSKCDGEVVKQSTKRHFAVLYKLEVSGAYCSDDQ